MVAEVPGIRTAAEQTVQGSDLGGDRLQHVFRQRQGPDLLADGFGETRRVPVGAARRMRSGWPATTAGAWSRPSRRTTVVVLPVPGPPVIRLK